MIEEKLIPYLIDSIKSYWDLPAFTNYPGPAMNYSEVGKQIIWLHRLFKTCGLTKGSKIALAGKNSANWAIVWLASVTYGATIVPILANFSADEMQHIVNHSDAEMFFVSKDKHDSLDDDAMEKCKYILCLENFSVLNNKADSRREFIKPLTEMDDIYRMTKESLNVPDVCDNEDIVGIIYTSGTTGFSKGVMLPHRSLMANIMYARVNLTFTVGAKVIAFLPLAHAYACSFDLAYPFTRGNHINFLDKLPTPKVLLAAMKDLKPEVVLCVPLLVEKIYKKQLQPKIEDPKIKTMLKIPLLKNVVYKKIRASLMEAFGGHMREMIAGGAPMNAEVEQFMKKIKFPFTIGYGMTECGPLVAYAGWAKHRFESSGQITDYLTARIESPKPDSIPGEVLLKGDQLFSGYYKNPEATAEVLHDGWLWTGDIGTLDKDNFVFLRGRSKNVILGSGGENIYPELVEQKLNNMPYVSESLVLLRNNVLYALVYPDIETLDQEKLGESQLPALMETNRLEVNKALASFSRIAKIQLVNEPFQKTPTQKIKRYLYS
ncbi:MAG TPA: AMP-binding protein [Candidatus Cloacimonadota bacterium]|nr:AMP-binding protein [Candidatus Cloacimonadota bacterium]HPS39272.1 AMP-binding protein [Candidatus Cloacimonadota bacterium]